MAVRVQFRRGTASQWASSTAPLAEGELGYATDTGQIRFGAAGGSTWVNSAIAAAGDINAVYAGTGLKYGSLTNAGGGGASSGTAGIVELEVNPASVIMASTITAKGDLIAGSGVATYVRLAKGTNNQFLTVNTSDATSNLSWSNTLTNGILKAPLEQWSIAATVPGTLNATTASAWYFTTNATANWTLNVTNVASLLAVGQTITVSAAVTNGTTGYYQSQLQIEGTNQAVKWNNGLTPATTGGSASAIDVYTFTILKTEATPTYVVFGSKTKFA